jgi:hypothetical protein
MEWGAIITGLLSIASLLLKMYMDRTPQRTQEERDEEINQGRLDIANGDTAAVGARIDSVSEAATGDPAKLGSDADTARRLAEITES